MNPMERSPGACPRWGPRHSRRLALVCALALAACAGPISAVRVDPKVVQADLARSATTTGEPSWPTRNVLHERGLVDAFAAQPETALADLHRAMVAAGGDPDMLFALAELSFLHGQAREAARLRPGGRRLRLRLSVPRRGRRGPRPVRSSAPDRGGPVQLGAHRELCLEGPGGGGPAGRHLRVALRTDRGGLRPGRAPRRGPRAGPVHPGGGAGGGRPGHAVSLARPRRPARRRHPAPRVRAARAGHGGAAAPGAGHRPPPDRRRPARPRPGRATRGHAGAPPGLGRGIGHDRRRAGPPRERADGRAGAQCHWRAGLRARDVWVSRPPLRALGGAAPARLHHALQARADPRGLRARHGLQHRPLDGHVQPAAGRPRDPQPLPGLVLPVRFRQPHRAVRPSPARGADRGRGAARP